MKTIKTVSKFLLMLFLLSMVVNELNNVITETVDVSQKVPHIMDIPQEETFDIDSKIDLSDTIVFYN
jgi:hypothetical protein